MTQLATTAAPTTTQTPLDIARAYIAAGVAVFPAREKTGDEFDPSTGEIIERSEKAPYTSNGLLGATRSGRIIGIWFGDRHPGALIGIPTGSNLGAWVLDLDKGTREDGTEYDGHEWLAAMEKQHGPLPKTAKATTANGGTHIFFKNVDGLRNRAAVAPGVDSRAEGGYICGPGSVMADGRRYEWIDWTDTDTLPDFLPAPQWLFDLFKAKEIPTATAATYTHKPTGQNPVYVERALDAELSRLASTPSGGRNQALNEAAFTIGRLVGGGHVTESEARSSLEGIAAQWPNFPKSRGTIARGLKDGMAQPREVPAPEYANDNTRPIDQDAISRMVKNSLARQAAKLVAKEPGTPTAKPATAQADTISEPANQPTTTPPHPREKPRFDLTWFDEIEEGMPKEMFIKGTLGVGEFTTISGLPGTGKSVIVTDMACHVAAGKEWHGKKVKQGLVIYVAAERKKLTERRMMAFRMRHDVHNVPLLVVGGRLDFTRDLTDARALITAVREAETITGLKCVWVIVDTLTRVFGAGDQNASKDMVRFVQSCDEIVSELGTHVTAIHHSAWSGERGKGAIDLDGAVDASFMVKKDHGKYKLICDGTNDGDEGDVLAFTMDSVTIGEDEDGEPTTAPVVVAAAVGAAKAMSSGTLKGYKGDVLAALQAAIEANGIEPGGQHFPEDVLVVDEATWREAFYEMRDMTNASAAETARKQFQRAPSALIKEGHVNQIGLWYWIA